MSVVMSKNFQGEVGKAYSGDDVFNIVLGAGFFVPSRFGVGVRVGVGNQLILQNAEPIVPAVSKRVFSRIYRLSGQPGGSGSTILQLRTYPGGAAPSHFAQITQAGRLRLVNAASGTVGETANHLPYGVEFRVVFTIDGGTFTAAVYPDTLSTTPTQVIGGAVTPVALDTVRDGVLQAGGMVDATLDVIWPVDDDAADPGLRQYVYAVLDRSSGVVPATVQIEVKHENLPSGTPSYSVDFGDGTVAGPQSSPLFVHTYLDPVTAEIVPSVEVL